jgi:hypothetical protein
VNIEHLDIPKVGKISRVELDNMEWNNLLSSLAGKKSISVLNNEEITINKLVSVDRNRCIPLINSTAVSKEIDTDVCSVVCGSLGSYYYRLWLAKHGYVEDVKKLQLEVGDINALFDKFIFWFKKQNFENYKNVGSMMVKASDGFNVGTLAAWLEEKVPMVRQDTRDMKIKSRKDMDLLYLNNIKSWALAAELIMSWLQNNKISGTDGVYKLAV